MLSLVHLRVGSPDSRINSEQLAAYLINTSNMWKRVYSEDHCAFKCALQKPVFRGGLGLRCRSWHGRIRKSIPRKSEPAKAGKSARRCWKAGERYVCVLLPLYWPQTETVQEFQALASLEALKVFGWYNNLASTRQQLLGVHTKFQQR